MDDELKEKGPLQTLSGPYIQGFGAEMSTTSSYLFASLGNTNTMSTWLVVLGWLVL